MSVLRVKNWYYILFLFQKDFQPSVLVQDKNFRVIVQRVSMHYQYLFRSLITSFLDQILRKLFVDFKHREEESSDIKTHLWSVGTLQINREVKENII